MLGLALALAVAAPSRDAVDDSNFALTSCSFAVVRVEVSKGFNRDRAAAALASGCTAQRARFRRLAIAALVARGMSRLAATADIDRELVKAESDLIAQFARFAALGLLEPAR